MTETWGRVEIGWTRAPLGPHGTVKARLLEP